jgi:hypothetical protein
MKMQFVNADEVDMNLSTEVRYNLGQMARCAITGKVSALRGFRDNGDHVWIEIDQAINPDVVPQKEFKDMNPPPANDPSRGKYLKYKILDKRPAVTFNPHGVMTARAKGKNPRTSQPNSVAVAMERVEARNSHSTLRQRNAIRNDGIQAFAHI